MGGDAARLRWRCRRGMRELDAVLGAFLDRLERAGESLSDADIATFGRILDLQDPELYGYLLGRSAPTDPAIAAFLARIRGVHA